VDREAVLLRVDFGEVGGVLLHEVERGGCDDSPKILKWSVISNVIDAHSRPTARGDPAAQGFVVKLGIVGFYFRLG
jgi:hypothetical protein